MKRLIKRWQVSRFASLQVCKPASHPQTRKPAYLQTCTLATCFLLLLLAACGGGSSAAGAIVGQNGIVVGAEFQDFYNEFGGRRVFGDPITEPFVDAENGRLVQYFHTMRLEYDQAAATNAMRVYSLGEWAFAGVAEPGTLIEGEFLTFYQEYQGRVLLGPAISPQLDMEGLHMQYFQNGRLEWHPELPIDQRVQLTRLGQAHFDAEAAFSYFTERQFIPLFSTVDGTDVQVIASMQAPILYAGEEQRLNVTVSTRDGQPLPGLNVQVTYMGLLDPIPLGATDDEGQIKSPLPVPDIPPGQDIELRVTVHNSAGNIVGSTLLVFQTWW